MTAVYENCEWTEESIEASQRLKLLVSTDAQLYPVINNEIMLYIKLATNSHPSHMNKL